MTATITDLATTTDRPITTVCELDALPIGTIVASVALNPDGVANVVAVRVSVEHWRTIGMSYGIAAMWVLGSGPVTVLTYGTGKVPTDADYHHSRDR